MHALHSGIDAWRTGPVPPPIDWLQQRYAERWSLYDGSLFERMAREAPFRNDPVIYRNTSLLWKHAEAVVDFYAGVVYQGALSDQPEQGAIPVQLLVAGDATAESKDGTPVDSPAWRLMRAIVELDAAWNWQQQMSLRPMYGAALGDCLTELVDDLDRRFVYPQIVWPGHVREIEIDYVGNVQRYVLEYRVEEPAGKELRVFTYRKEVDKEAFHHFRNDQPWDRDGEGAVVPNPYGFVPAIWDRHRIAAPGMVRGKSALDGTRQALFTLNSVFSHAFDYQRKAFWQPVMLAGRGGGGTIDLSTPKGTGREQAQTLTYITVPDGSTLLQAGIDLGQTRGLLEDLRAGILAENPEGVFYQQLREMSQVTAPGAERMMGDVKNRVDLCRAGYDENTVKLRQMAIAIAGFRVNGGEWQRRNPGGRLTRRQLAFAPFDLASFAAGDLDFAIQSRPLVAPTDQERIELIVLKESLQTTWGMTEAGLGQKAAEAIQAERQARFATALNDGSFGQDFAS